MHQETVLITGAGRGLGRATALAFAETGASLVVCSRSREDLETLSKEVQNKGGQCFSAKADVNHPDDMDNLLKKAVETMGPISVLVNNAAVIGPPEFLASRVSPDWFETLDINLKGPVVASQAVLPLMLKQGVGTIVNIISGLAWMAFPRFSAYCASKAGLYHLTQCLAEEYRGQNILFYSVDPGVMDTPMQSEIRSLDKNRLGPLGPQFQQLKDTGQLRSPAKVANLIVTLASRRPEKYNGKTVSLSDLPNLTH